MGLAVLIIGCGAIAGGHDADRDDKAWPRTHAAAYRRDGGYRLVACVDPDPERRAAFAARWGVEHAFADVSQAQSAGPYDIISICSPTSLHAAHLEYAIGMHPRLVVCEKPVTPTLAETRRLVAQASAAGVGLAVNHTRRWAPDILELATELKAGTWGQLRSCYAAYNKGVLNNGSHLFDLLLFLLGPLRVLAAGTPVSDFAMDDPSVPCLLETSAGIPISVSIAHAADYALFEMSLVTEHAVISMEAGGSSWRIRPVVDSPDFAGYRALMSGTFRAGRYEEAMVNAVAEFRHWIAGKACISSSGESAAAAQALSDAVLALAGPVPATANSN